MTRASAKQQKHTPWFAKAGAACSIVPIARPVGEHAFALKGEGYCVLFELAGADEESLSDRELDSSVRGLEGALRGLTEGFVLHQYARILSGYEIPRQPRYSSLVTEHFVSDWLDHLSRTAEFRRINLYWCLSLEPAAKEPFSRKPQEQAGENTRLLAELLKTATILQSHLGHCSA